MSSTILVVDDKSSVRQLLREYLAEQGYRIVEADNGENALYTARHVKPDLILLDIMMPKMDGYEFIRQYRKEARTPVIIITARQEETDAVLGLELGADDYVVKPFRMRELLARIHSVFRRSEAAPEQEECLQHAGLRMNLTTHEVSLNDRPVSLTPIEFDLLASLMKSPGRVFTRSQLVDSLFESGFTGLERTLNVHIRNLRKKIEPNPAEPQYIESVFGVGYRFSKEIS
ncbi:transcriptional regulator [Ornatilinea apprima]|uniref:Transcriptional regulator n=1 Tax=Ornatilinea apprima TaxID=1134406 RepID=A0A0P6XPY0_9CHLR|nr:response regulator transcription factor [Ornatilinea apprima]KPL77321.1 transcriptional regulator [Ornatilinea apprima]